MDLDKITTYSLADRMSKVCLENLGKSHTPNSTFNEFIDSLPRFLGAADLIEVAGRIAKAHLSGKTVILGMGAHPIKVGLSPVIIDLIQRKVINALALNGAGVIHDFELALTGATSEDVDKAILDGSFGMAEETGNRLNKAITDGVAENLGIGEAVGKLILNGDFPNKDKSLLATCKRLKIPATVHVAIGTDIIHMHPGASGAAIGEGSLRDFRSMAEVVSGLKGGAYINLGSAVLLPEVFLKALTLARNLGHDVTDITTVNMDFIQHYRPGVNVLKRPTLGSGKAFALTGHHEIMLPLLAAMVIEQIK